MLATQQIHTGKSHGQSSGPQRQRSGKLGRPGCGLMGVFVGDKHGGGGGGGGGGVDRRGPPAESALEKARVVMLITVL